MGIRRWPLQPRRRRRAGAIRCWLVTGSTSVANGAWRQVAGVWDGTNLTVYVDGGQAGQNQPASAPGWDYTPAATIGASLGGNGPGNLFNGKIDEVRVSSAAVYTGSFSPSAHLTASSSTMGLWKFDLQTTNDASSNQNNGTLYGGASYSTDVPPNGTGNSLIRRVSAGGEDKSRAALSATLGATTREGPM